MKLPFSLGDFLWSPRDACLDLARPQPNEVVELRKNRVEALVRVSPQPECDCYVAELAGGKVIGNTKLVSTAINTVIGDIQFLYGATRPDEHWILSQHRLRFPQRLARKAAVLAASNAENYYHWLFDSLPRLHLLELAGHALDEIDFFLLDDSKRAFQT